MARDTNGHPPDRPLRIARDVATIAGHDSIVAVHVLNEIWHQAVDACGTTRRREWHRNLQQAARILGFEWSGE